MKNTSQITIQQIKNTCVFSLLYAICLNNVQLPFTNGQRWAVLSAQEISHYTLIGDILSAAVFLTFIKCLLFERMYWSVYF